MLRLGDVMAIAARCRRMPLGFSVLHGRPNQRPRGLAALDCLPMNPPSAPRVLVVDDDPDLRDLLRDYLGASGFTVDLAEDGRQMVERMAAQAPDVLVLDIMLPGQDGLSLARAVRRESELLPILMLSARGEELDRVVGLEVGADDYLSKPFSPRELLARLRALLRRSGAQVASTGRPAEHAQRSSFGPFVLDVESRRLLRGTQEVALNGAEFELLSVFAKHPNRVLSRDDLIGWLKGYERDAFDRSIDVRVLRLRRRIEDDPTRPKYVRTVRGEGYLFTPLGD